MDVVGICNAALGLVGSGSITALDDATTEAGLCTRLYTPARDAVLAERVWTFATERVTVAADATAPAYGYAYRYAIPSTTLRVLEVGDGTSSSDVDWRREGAFVLTDQAGPIFMRVLKRIEDPALWSPGFVQALTYRLAADLCTPLNENRTLRADLWNLYQSSLKTAAYTDGMQGRGEPLRAGRLSSVRG